MEKIRKKILLIDDSPIIINYLIDLLKELKNTGPLFKAANYEDAIKVLEQEQPHIVLLDIHLPGKNGIEVLRYIKEKHPATIVIMLTNQSDDSYRTLCKKIGADYFFDKSADFEKIPEIITSHL
jgi:DNA-binding NarL/FixJ family response regulator